MTAPMPMGGAGLFAAPMLPHATMASAAAPAAPMTPDARLMAQRFGALLAALEQGASERTGTETLLTEEMLLGAQTPREQAVVPAPRAEREALAALREWIIDVSGQRAEGEAPGATELLPPSREEVDAILDAMAEAVEGARLPTGEVAMPATIAAARTDVPVTTRAEPRSADARAANAAAANATAANGVAVRDLEALHPELRIRVERVVTRMQQEFGHQVAIVETLRSAERQEALYAQGRSQPGPVVTWTRDSLHERGAAADLQVDGTWNDPVAYARLQRIAREEGLYTLGQKDAGHVEWRDGAVASHTPSHTHTHTAAVPRASQQAAVAQVAHVASVAQVAQVAQAPRVASVASVARVARVASPGAAQRATTPSGGAPDAAITPAPEMPMDLRLAEPLRAEHDAPALRMETRPRAAAGTIAAATSTAARDEMREMIAPDAGTTAQGSGAQGFTAQSPDAALPLQATRAETMVASADSANAATRTADAAPTQASRIDQMDAIDETRRQQPLQSITLRVEDAQGQDHRIRVDLRGSEVRADITTASGAQAQLLADALPELRQRLGQQGLEAGPLQVRSWIAEGPAASGDRSAQDRGDSSQRQPHEQHQDQQQQQDQQMNHGSARDGRGGQTASRRRFDLSGDLA